MSNSSQIFDVVVNLSLLISWGSSTRIARIDTLEDTEATKVLERDLKTA
jgi:hypothetical protein